MGLLRKDGSILQRPAPLSALELFGAIKSIRPLGQIEREAIESAMILCQGNYDEAAARLGISRATLYRKTAHYIALDAPTVHG